MLTRDVKQKVLSQPFRLNRIEELFMGYSDPTNKPWTQAKIAELAPTTVLDVGAGQGVYLDLIRQALGAGVIVNAVEVWEPYMTSYFIWMLEIWTVLLMT
jgi:2-polyprenyl-3-methyl-5-hydroxy-6-metoxy-1,4-benzoquinol methylase